MADQKQFELDQNLVEEFNSLSDRLVQESNINWSTCTIKCEALFGVDKLSQEEQDKLKREERNTNAEIWEAHDKLVDAYKAALETGETVELLSVLEETKNSPFCKSLNEEKIGVVVIIEDGKESKELAAHWNGNINDFKMYQNVPIIHEGKVCQAKVAGIYLEKDELKNISKTQAFRAGMSEVDINKAIAKAAPTQVKEPKTLQDLLESAREQKAMMNRNSEKNASKQSRDERE